MKYYYSTVDEVVLTHTGIEIRELIPMPKAFMDFMGYEIYFWSNGYSGNELEPIHHMR